MANRVLNLDGVEPFGVGGRRLCFVHPEDETKCIKVLRSDDERVIRSQKSLIPVKWRRIYDNNAHEQKELARIYSQAGAAMAAHFPMVHGEVDTTLGKGLVLDLMRDEDGAIARDVRVLLQAGFPLDELRSVFNQFGNFLLQYRILTRNLLDHNLVVTMGKQGPKRMYMIDGMGDPAWVPIARWIPMLGRRKIEKRLATAWQRFENYSKKGCSK